jgi:hypothetical protein
VKAALAVKCEYCGRYGPLGACEGCGAPNRPDKPMRWITTTQAIETTHLRSLERECVEFAKPTPPRLRDVYR